MDSLMTSLVLIVASPLVVMVARKFLVGLPERIIVGVKTKWVEKLEKKEIDADLNELGHTIGIAIVKYVEKKIPDEGMGEERMTLVLNLFYSIPYVGRFLRPYEVKLKELIEAFVKAMDKEAKEELGAEDQSK